MSLKKLDLEAKNMINYEKASDSSVVEFLRFMTDF